jgi:hypothetical protein
LVSNHSTTRQFLAAHLRSVPARSTSLPLATADKQGPRVIPDLQLWPTDSSPSSDPTGTRPSAAWPARQCGSASLENQQPPPRCLFPNPSVHASAPPELKP